MSAFYPFRGGGSPKADIVHFFTVFLLGRLPLVLGIKDLIFGTCYPNFCPSSSLYILDNFLQYINYHQQCRSHNVFMAKEGSLSGGPLTTFVFKSHFYFGFETIFDNSAFGSEVVHHKLESSCKS